jgi:hypothetical protein
VVVAEVRNGPNEGTIRALSQYQLLERFRATAEKALTFGGPFLVPYVDLTG